MFKKLKAAVKGEKKKKSKREECASSASNVGNNKRAAEPTLSSSEHMNAAQESRTQTNENAKHFIRENSSKRTEHNVGEQEAENLGFSRSPQFDSIFLDDSKQKKGYLNSLKKRLTFSNPPKNSDTDTFLCELSAQFDAKMNLLDDITIPDDDVKEHGFGEKWSYFTKEENEAMLTEATNHSLLSMTVTSQNACHVSPAKQIANFQEFDDHKTTKNDSVVTPQTQDLDRHHDASCPIEQEVALSPTSSAANGRFRDEPRTKNPGSQQVRRRRRRNPAANQSKSKSSSEINGSSRRTSDPLPTFGLSEENKHDEVIYDVPKPVALSQPRRAHVNTEKRTRRLRANRRQEILNKRNSTELQMQVSPEIDSINSVQNVKLRSSSPVEQASFFDRAKKKNYRVSGVSLAMEDVFTRAEEDLHNNSFSPKLPPPLPDDLARVPRDNPSDIYLPLEEEDLAAGLAYEEECGVQEEEDEAPQSHNLKASSDEVSFQLLPPPMAPPPPPPPPIPPPVLSTNTNPSNVAKKSVKRINWVKIEPVDLSNTVWGQLGEDPDTVNDVVEYFDLEEHFAMRKAKDLSQRNVEIKKETHCLLAHKKAYNTSILLAHLKLTSRQICDCLMICGSEQVRRRVDASHYKQLLMYAPNEEEVEKLKGFDEDLTKLNEVDKLAIKLVNIPGYHLRLKALIFKLNFAEKEEEIQKNLEVIQLASLQLRKSRKLAKILEFVLAMGNYMNRGHNRISKATGFRIQFLAEVDSTKTSDNKLTFLHILIRAAMSKFPDAVSFPEEVTDVRAASRVVYPAVVEELQELRKVWLHIRDNLQETLPNTRQDKFKIAMETCLVRTNASLKRLEQLQNSTIKEYHKVAKYFGENPKNIGMQQFFKIFDEFTRKFEVRVSLVLQ